MVAVVVILPTGEFLIVIKGEGQRNFVADRTKIGGLVQRLEEGFFVKIGSGLHQLLVDPLKRGRIAFGKRIVQGFFDGVGAITHGAVYMGDGVANGAGNPGMGRHMVDIVIFGVIKSPGEKGWRRRAPAGTSARGRAGRGSQRGNLRRRNCRCGEVAADAGQKRRRPARPAGIPRPASRRAPRRQRPKTTAPPAGTGITLGGAGDFTGTPHDPAVAPRRCGVFRVPGGNAPDARSAKKSGHPERRSVRAKVGRNAVEGPRTFRGRRRRVGMMK